MQNACKSISPHLQNQCQMYITLINTNINTYNAPLSIHVYARIEIVDTFLVLTYFCCVTFLFDKHISSAFMLLGSPFLD